MVIERDVIETAKQDGIEEGRQKGLQEGLQKGLQEGQQQERLRIAQSLLDLIADDSVLAAKTGLSTVEVCNLRLACATDN